MFYKNALTKLLENEKNPVNSMYLHEVNIKWKNLEKAAEESKDSNESLVKMFNKFISAVSSRKYHYKSETGNGFKEDSPLFSSCYLNDLISVLIQRRQIMTHQGIKWDFQSFNTNLKFNPKNLCSLEKDLMFDQSLSPEFLQLTQELDSQFRVIGKRTFHKYKSILPLIVFHTFRNLTEEDFIRTEYYANMAKSSFEKSKTIIITEMLDENFIPVLRSSKVDFISVLRKQFKTDKPNEISIDAVNALEEKVKELLTEQREIGDNFKETGMII